MRKFILKLFLLALLLTAGSASVQTAKAGDTEDVGTQSTDSETPLPIDGGVILLLAAGAGYGIKKRRASLQKKREEQLP